MADVSDLALLTGGSALINSVYAIKTGKNPVIPLVASGVSFVGLSIVGGVTKRYDLVTAIAWLFFFGSLMIHGAAIVSTGVDVATKGDGKAAVKAKTPAPSSTGSSSSKGGATGKGSSGAGGGGGAGGAW